MNERITIYKGQDKNFNVKLRKSNGDPLSLVDATDIKLFLKKANRQNLELNLDEVPAQRATVTYSDVTFSADTIGASGNSIVLNFDGVHTIDEVVGSWNSAHPANTVSHNGDGSTVFPTKELSLNGGQDAYYPVTITDDKLGFIQVIMNNNETQGLRRGEDQDLDVIIDYGAHVGGTRLMAKLRGRVDVYKIT